MAMLSSGLHHPRRYRTPGISKPVLRVTSALRLRIRDLFTWFLRVTFMTLHSLSKIEYRLVNNG